MKERKKDWTKERKEERQTATERKEGIEWEREMEKLYYLKMIANVQVFYLCKYWSSATISAVWSLICYLV